MGGQPWFYFVKYRQDADRAFEELRQREFEAGRYNPVIKFPNFPTGPESPAPGAKHHTIQAARDEAAADGTRSILDMDRIGQRHDFGVVVSLRIEKLLELYGTATPTREAVDANMGFLEEIHRGHGVYFVVYYNGKPSEICFAGYSYD